MSANKQERIGEFMVLFQAMVYGLFPVIISYAGGLIPPLLFAGLSTLLAAVVLFVYLLVAKKINELGNVTALKYILLVTLFTVVLGYGFITIGGSMTSGVNTSILFQSEILFTFLICGLFFGEKMPAYKILAAILVALGTIIIVYDGSFVLNKGDMLVILGTFFFPFGNTCAKKALKLVHPSTILFVRSIIGGSFLIFLSFLLENTYYDIIDLMSTNWLIIVINGFVLFGLIKIIWYEGLKRLDVSKAITIGMSYSAFGFVYSMLLLKERPTSYQLIGFFVVMIGILIITRREKRQELLPSENI